MVRSARGPGYIPHARVARDLHFALPHPVNRGPIFQVAEDLGTNRHRSTASERSFLPMSSNLRQNRCLEKWGEPSVRRKRSGSPARIAWETGTRIDGGGPNGGSRASYWPDTGTSPPRGMSNNHSPTRRKFTGAATSRCSRCTLTSSMCRYGANHIRSHPASACPRSQPSAPCHMPCRNGSSALFVIERLLLWRVE